MEPKVKQDDKDANLVAASIAQAREGKNDDKKPGERGLAPGITPTGKPPLGTTKTPTDVKDSATRGLKDRVRTAPGERAVEIPPDEKDPDERTYS